MAAPTNSSGCNAASSRARRRRSSPWLLLLPAVLLALAPAASALDSNQLLFANGTAITLERRRDTGATAPTMKPSRRGGSSAAAAEGKASGAAAQCCVPLSGSGDDQAAAAVTAVDPAFALHSDASCSPRSRLCALPAKEARAVWVCGCGGSGSGSGGADGKQGARCFGGRAAAAAAPGSTLGDSRKGEDDKSGQVQGGLEAFLRGDGAVVAVRVAVASSSSGGGGSSKGGGGKGPLSSSSSSSSSSRCPVRGLQLEYTGGATLTIGAGFNSSSSLSFEVKELALLPGEALVAVAGRVAGAPSSPSSSSSSSSRRPGEARGRGGGGRASSERSSSNTACLAYVSLETSHGRELSAGRKKSGSSSSSSPSSSRGEGGGLAVARAPQGSNSPPQRLVAAVALVRPDGSLGWLRPLWGHDGCPLAAAAPVAPPVANAPKPTLTTTTAAPPAPAANAPESNKPQNAAAAPQTPPSSSSTPSQQPQQQPSPQSPPRPPSNAYPLCGPPQDPVCDRSTTPPRCFCMTDPPDNFLGQTCPEDGSCVGGCCATTGQCPRVMGREAPKGYSGGPVQFFLAKGCADWGLQPSAERAVAEGKAKNASEAMRLVLPACGKGVPADGQPRPECGALYECVPPRGRPCAPGLPGALCMGYTRCKDEAQCVGASNEAACVYRPDGSRAFDVCGCRPIYPPPTAPALSERRRRRRRLVF